MQEIEKSKVIYIDFGMILHRAVYSKAAAIKRQADLILPSTYNALAMIISNLKKVGVNKGDLVLICVDSRNNWRKILDKNYKAGRKKQRDSATVIDWNKEFKDFDILLEQIEKGSPFHILKVPTLECDDLIAIGTKLFNDRKNVIVSFDSDFLHLLVREGVRVFSPHPKAKNCPYKILDLDRKKEIEKAYKTLAKKIKKEVSDGLVSDVLTEQDFEIRESIVSLLNLPKFVEDSAMEELKEVTVKSEDDYDINELPFQSIRNRFNDIYKKDKIVSYESCKLKFAKKLLNKKKTKKKGVKNEN